MQLTTNIGSSWFWYKFDVNFKYVPEVDRICYVISSFVFTARIRKPAAFGALFFRLVYLCFELRIIQILVRDKRQLPATSSLNKADRVYFNDEDSRRINFVTFQHLSFFIQNSNSFFWNILQDSIT